MTYGQMETYTILGDRPANLLMQKCIITVKRLLIVVFQSSKLSKHVKKVHHPSVPLWLHTNEVPPSRKLRIVHQTVPLLVR